MSRTMGGLFLSALQRHPERTFVRQLGDAVEYRPSYRDAALRLAATVAALRSLGTGRGDRIVCYLEQPRDAIFFMLSAACAGVTIVPLPPGHSTSAVKRLMNRVGARHVMSTPTDAARLVEDGLTPLCYEYDGSWHDGVITIPTSAQWSVEAATAFLEDRCSEVEGDHAYIIIPTSGTTGDPKLVVRSHRSFTSIAPHMQLGKKRDAAEQERVLMAAALTHGIGHANFAFGLYMAAEFSVPRASEGATRLTEVRVLDPTYIYCNPRVVNALLAQYEGDGAKGRIFGPSARVLRLSGGPSTPQMRGFIAEQGIDVGETYGASEAGAIACTPFGQTGMRVLPDVEVKIGDDNELLVRTARGMTCYYGDDSLRDQYFTDDGFYITGDRGQLTEKGELRFWSRKRDALTLPDGTTINPVWIESLLEARAWVSQVVLIGDQRPYLVALIVVRDEHDSRFEDGYLEPGAHGELFSRARADIEIVNAKLEPMERIRRFALFSRPMPPEIYAEARGGKTRRERGAIERMFADRIDALYANVV